MAVTAVTAQALIETARQKLIKATQSIELYIQVNNPGRLATLNTDLDAAEAAIAAAQA